MIIPLRHCLSLIAIASASVAQAQSPAGVQAKLDVGDLLEKPDAWFAAPEGKAMLDRVLSWQNANGGWWKAYDLSTTRPAHVEDKPGIAGDDDSVWHRTSTIDNAATVSELRLLARAIRLSDDVRYRVAFDRGFGFLIGMQYTNGGFPQRFPIEENYGSHITLNDDAMVRVLLLLRDVRDAAGDFAFVTEAQREAAERAFEKGITCLIDLQIVIDGTRTIWCQQHDATTLAPAKARSYELPSLATTESAAVTNLLLDLPDPDARVRAAIEAAVAWFEANKIEGKKVEKLTGPQYENGREVRVVDAPDSVIWARFYNLQTGQPFMCDRDGIKVDSITKLTHDRRVGYAWYGSRPAKVLERYATWKLLHGG